MEMMVQPPEDWMAGVGDDAVVVTDMSNSEKSR
jgi:hypothetical protein